MIAENELPMEVRKHSWWRPGDGSKRLFVIVELPIDLTTPNTDPVSWKVHYSRVGLLEYGFDEPIDLPVEQFVADFTSGRLVPVNKFPRTKR